ncbi:hypothetical protein C8Q78DRAFT_687644 [Trametes maxima]|nr:hypothetical protein C8Q78DRAFT_687644 [Trametes maxima]
MAVFIRICPAQTLLALLTLSSSPSLKSVFDVVPLWISLRAHHSSAQDHCPFMRVHIFRTFESESSSSSGYVAWQYPLTPSIRMAFVHSPSRPRYPPHLLTLALAPACSFSFSLSLSPSPSLSPSFLLSLLPSFSLTHSPSFSPTPHPVPHPVPRPCPCPHPHLIVLPCSLPPSLTRTRTRQPDFTLVLPSSSPTSRILVVADSLSPSPTRFRRC